MTTIEASVLRPAVAHAFAEVQALKSLSHEHLPRVAGEISGHLADARRWRSDDPAARLSAVELGITLRRVFHAPQDRVLFGSDDQAYAHGALVGGGHDPFRGEAPENLLARAAVLARTGRLRGEGGRFVIAVVRVGATTTGESVRAALAQLGVSREPVVVVLDDDGPAGEVAGDGLARQLASLRAGRVVGHNLFQLMGLSYLGPVPSHDGVAVEMALRQAAALRRPTVVHRVAAPARGAERKAG